MQTVILNANIARAKLRYNKKTELYRIVVAFNVFPEEDEDGRIVYRFPVQSKCDFVSGDFGYEDVKHDVERVTALAKRVLRTDNIEFV